MPAGPITGDEGWNTWEANKRAMLHDIADEICREDLFTLAEIARLLFVSSQGGRAAVLAMIEMLEVQNTAWAGIPEWEDYYLRTRAAIEERLDQLDANVVDEVEQLLLDAWQTDAQ